MTSPSPVVCEISINGRTCSVPVGQTVGSLLAWLKIKADRVAVELNRQVIPQRDWTATPVQPGAQVEIVEFVGGG